VRGAARRWRGLVLCCAGVAAGACVSTPEAQLGELAGCYYFERDAAAEDLRLPWGVHFLPESLQGWPAWEEHPGVRSAVTLVNETEARAFPFGYWRPLGGDSLEVGHPGGGGLILRLAVEPGRLEGTVRPVGDVLRPPGDLPAHSPQPVALRLARCPGA
jgi:hypothetical protein